MKVKEKFISKVKVLEQISSMPNLAVGLEMNWVLLRSLIQKR